MNMHIVMFTQCATPPPGPQMKTERVTLLTSPEFKAFLGSEAARENVSVAELVRSRCEPRPSDDDVVLSALTAELRTAVSQAKRSLRDGLAEAQNVLAELRAQRGPGTQAQSAAKLTKAATKTATKAPGKATGSGRTKVAA